MNIRTDVRLDKAEFFAWIDRQDRRYELADGRVVVQPYATRHHARMCTNITAALIDRLDRAAYDITQGDFAVETGPKSVRYADVMVSPFSSAGDVRSTTDALVLFEVLSASTMHVDFGEKLDEYKRLPLLDTYLVCAQDEARVWAWTRLEGRWPDIPQIAEGHDASVALPALGTVLPLSEIYRNMPFGTYRAVRRKSRKISVSPWRSARL